MAGNQLPFAEGASINRPPLFCGDNYPFWKVRMKIFMESVSRGIWQAVITEYKTPTQMIDDSLTQKPFENWSQEEIKRAEYDSKALNIIHSALNSDEFFRISACTTAKEAWDLIQVTHEGTPEVRRARKNTLVQEYEMFRMSPGETVMDVQKRLTHIVNHLKGLGKVFDEEELNVKILKSLNRKWQPTVTAITESKNLAAMTSAELFGKLREYEMDMSRIAEEEQKDKKGKGLALKTAETSSNEDNAESENSETENMNLMVRKFRKFLKKKNGKNKPPQFKKLPRKSETSSPRFTCFECGKNGHIKADCPNLPKRPSNDEQRTKFKSRRKKAYIAWEENASTTSSESESDQEANLCLMTRHDTDTEVSDSDFSIDSSYDQLQDAFIELHKEAQKLDFLTMFIKRRSRC